MLRTLALALLLLSISGSALAPPPPITALAAFEVLADGFGALRGIAVDDDDRVYVADRETGTVTRLDVEGRSVIARRLERPVGLALGLDGRLTTQFVLLPPTGLYNVMNTRFHTLDTLAETALPAAWRRDRRPARRLALIASSCGTERRPTPHGFSITFIARSCF